MVNLVKSELYKDGIFNKETVDELLKLNDPMFIIDVLETFKEESPKYLREVQAHFKQRDYDRMRINLHQLKGSCGTIGAEQVRLFIIGMMDKIEKGRMSSLERDCKQLSKLLTDLYAMLDIVYEIKA